MRFALRTLFFACLICVVAHAESSAPRVGILTDGVSPFWTAMRDAALLQAAERGATLDFRMPSSATAEQQQELAHQMLESGVKAIAICPVKPQEQRAFLDELSSRTALATVRVDAPESKRVVHIGRDERELGKLLGQLVANSTVDGLKVMAFFNSLEQESTRLRLDGLKESLQSTNIVVEEGSPDFGDRMLAWANVDDALAKRPEIACLIGLQPYHGPAMLRAAVERERAKWVRIVSVSEALELEDAIREGSVAGAVIDDPEGYARVALDALLDLANASAAAPENALALAPMKILKADASAATEEMMDALRVQVPWISEVAPGTP